MCPTSSAVWKLRRPPHFGHVSPSRGSRMSAKRRLEVAAVLGAPQVPAGAVRADDELALAQRLVGEDRAGVADRSDRARVGPERRPDLVLGRGPDAAAERGGGLRLLEAVVAADEREHERPVLLHDRHRLGGGGSVDAEELGQRLDRRHARRLDLLGSVEPRRELGRARDAARDLEVGRVVAVLAGDQRVLARARRREEVDGLAPAHHPRLGLDGVVLEPAALEDAVVGALVQRGSSSPGPPRRGRTSTSPS